MTGNNIVFKLRQSSLKPCIREKNILTAVMLLVLFTSFMSGIFVKFLPYEFIEGNPVPTVIFRGLPSTFHAFVISIIFAFAGAFSSLLTRGNIKYAKYEKFCRFCSLVFMLLAVAILVYAVSLACLRSGNKIPAQETKYFIPFSAD